MRKSRYFWWALGMALFVGFCGIYPHLRISFETGRLAWFFNSYDEGFYGWESIHGWSLHRLLPGLAMKALLAVVGGETVGMMVLADLVLPFGVTVAACFAVRPLVRSGAGMAAAALFVVMAAELLAFRSVLAPTYQFLPLVAAVRDAIDARPEGIFPHGNETSVFWVFRTPEPQVSWIVMFLLVGAVARFVRIGSQRWWIFYVVMCCVGGFGYFLAMLPLFGALGLAGIGMLLGDRKRGLRVLVPAAGGMGILFVWAFASSKTIGADSLVFESRMPVMLATGIFGGILVCALGLHAWNRRAVTPTIWLAMGLAVTPLVMANQQIVTGRMLYLFNFENFGFSQLVALAFVTTPLAWRFGSRHSAIGKTRRLATAGAVLFLAGMLISSQASGYAAYRETNRQQDQYAVVIDEISPSESEVVAVEDIFVADTLALAVGWRPNYLLSRDLFFTKSVQRLRDEGDVPKDRVELKPRLFEHFALMGLSSEEFANWLDAVGDPANPDWQGRFLAGGFLFSQADFWAPLTHSRDLRLDWIRAEKPQLVADYEEFLESDWFDEPVVVVGKWEAADYQRFRQLGRVKKLGPDRDPGELRATRVLPRH